VHVHVRYVQTPWCDGGNFYEYFDSADNNRSCTQVVTMLFEVLRVRMCAVVSNVLCNPDGVARHRVGCVA